MKLIKIFSSDKDVKLKEDSNIVIIDNKVYDLRTELFLYELPPNSQHVYRGYYLNDDKLYLYDGTCILKNVGKLHICDKPNDRFILLLANKILYIYCIRNSQIIELHGDRVIREACLLEDKVVYYEEHMIHRKYFRYDISRRGYIGDPILMRSYPRRSEDGSDDESIDSDGERYTDEKIDIRHSNINVGDYSLEIKNYMLCDRSNGKEYNMGFGTDIHEIMKTHQINFYTDFSNKKQCVKWNNHIIYIPNVDPDYIHTYKNNNILLVYNNKVYLHNLLSENDKLVIIVTKGILSLDIIGDYICVIFHDRKYSIYDSDFNFIEYVNNTFNSYNMYKSYIINRNRVICNHDMTQYDKWNITFYKNHLICRGEVYKIDIPIMKIIIKKYDTTFKFDYC